jgi:hypothetical protein
MNIVHIVPNNDTREHRLNSRCSCRPERLDLKRGRVYTHNAFDGRETAESETGQATEGKNWTIHEL